jgi:hypothetical protein
LTLPLSAYHATLAAGQDDVADLLTPTAAYRIRPGRAPVKTPLDLGFGAAVRRASYVYWSGGAVREAPKADASADRPPRSLTPLARQPQMFVASDAGIAWLRRTDAGRFSLETVAGGKVATLYQSLGAIDAVTMAGDALFFVERPSGSPGGWRIGRLPLAGGAATFTSARAGRPPAMLAAGRDLAFYQGSGFEVHRLSFDFQHERIPASGFVCSPLAVAQNIYCAQVEGIFELRPDAAPRRLAPGSPASPVADIAIGPGHLYWLVDAGPERLEVRALPVPP